MSTNVVKYCTSTRNSTGNVYLNFQISAHGVNFDVGLKSSWAENSHLRLHKKDDIFRNSAFSNRDDKKFQMTDVKNDSIVRK